MKNGQSKKKPILKFLLIGCGTITVLVVVLIIGVGVWLFSGPEDTEMTAYHPFRSATAKEQYLKLYDMRAKKWPVESETRFVDTSYGQTFVRMSGPVGVLKDKTIDDFDPANVVTIMISPLSGTLVPGSSGRTEVQAIGVQSVPIGWFTRSNFGGRFSSMLKFEGWDGIVIEGKADAPVWLDIRNDRVKIRNCKIPSCGICRGHCGAVVKMKMQ